MVLLNLTEFFSCFSLTYNTNARLKFTKTVHVPYSSKLVVVCVVLLLIVLFYVLFVCKLWCYTFCIILCYSVLCGVLWYSVILWYSSVFFNILWYVIFRDAVWCYAIIYDILQYFFIFFDMWYSLIFWYYVLFYYFLWFSPTFVIFCDVFDHLCTSVSSYLAIKLRTFSGLICS